MRCSIILFIFIKFLRFRPNRRRHARRGLAQVATVRYWTPPRRPSQVATTRTISTNHRDRLVLVLLRLLPLPRRIIGTGPTIC